MTRDEHIARHKMLHASLDEILADFLAQNPHRKRFREEGSLEEFLGWSYRQTLNPTGHTHDVKPEADNPEERARAS